MKTIFSTGLNKIKKRNYFLSKAEQFNCIEQWDDFFYPTIFKLKNFVVFIG